MHRPTFEDQARALGHRIGYWIGIRIVPHLPTKIKRRFILWAVSEGQ